MVREEEKLSSRKTTLGGLTRRMYSNPLWYCFDLALYPQPFKDYHKPIPKRIR